MPQRPYKVIADSKADRQVWLQARANHITASEAAGLLGFTNPRWGTPEQKYQEKLERMRTVLAFGRDLPEIKSRRLSWGHLLEDAVMQGWAELERARVRSCGVLLESVEFPWLAATPDGFARHPEYGFGLIEIKTVSAWQLPDYYLPQVSLQQFVTGVGRAFLVGLLGKFVDEWKVIDRDENVERELIRRLAAIWERLQKDVYAGGQRAIAG